jgi:hypothetical protein
MRFIARLLRPLRRHHNIIVFKERLYDKASMLSIPLHDDN